MSITEKPPLFGGSWYSWPCSYIENGWIIVDSQNVGTYNPFDYVKDTPLAIVEEILGKKEIYQPMAIYTLFANLDADNPNQILSWCKHFGLPEYRSGRYSLNEFKLELRYFKNVLLLVDAINSFSTDQLINLLLSSRTLGIVISPLTSDEDGIRRDPIAVAKKELANTINGYIKERVWPLFSVQTGGPDLLKLRWRITSLLSAMYFMLGMDMAIRPPKKCGCKTCQKYLYLKMIGIYIAVILAKNVKRRDVLGTLGRLKRNRPPKTGGLKSNSDDYLRTQ
jgi:hypothetical protein